MTTVTVEHLLCIKLMGFCKLSCAFGILVKGTFFLFGTNYCFLILTFLCAEGRDLKLSISG